MIEAIVSVLVAFSYIVVCVLTNRATDIFLHAEEHLLQWQLQCGPARIWTQMSEGCTTFFDTCEYKQR